MGGGSTLLLCMFGKPVVGYWGRKMEECKRENFWEDKFGNKNIKNYHYMINPNLKAFVDTDGEDMINNDYNNFLMKVRETFK